MNKHKNKNDFLKKLEKKYDKLVAVTYQRMKDKPINEFCDELERLKKQLQEEIESGCVSEDK